MNKHGLGRGLDALIPTEQEGIETIQEINIDEIVVNNKQPRKDFDEEKLEELAASMEQHGVLQPVILRKVGRGYELVAGERRWRAAAKAGIKKIPAVVKELSDGDVLEIALIENLQREDLNPIEEASAYKQLMDEFGLTQEELAKRVGKSRSQIANTLRLLNLEEEILKFIFEGKLTAGHARALLSIEDKKLRYGLAKKISNEGLSVRQAEQLAQNLLQKKEKKSSRQTTISPIMSDIAEKLQQSLGTKVRIRGSEKRGKIEIEFYSSEELERILEVIAEQ
ncbi:MULTISPECIES: ParB/RepB/Spo0J family partition protein [Tepidanaerobacter]|uniref:Chromosome partitioning protein, ParB family n=1 Tax=Tepidanaerobacter syntrophicus TaxID=224999 RepID=A0A0U9HFH0_9FIRM|nr:MULTISPECIES: ParB/RepB/Spo0J family partition protein [Tepidanaerobacter]GAQ24875.1 chromosome partitioning protein, ParB family [Tepidanaerobacter syntrophicus]GLI18857.1 chromosome partitioning protein ParB [Tepidanaerobacter syntrophicus]GLI51287.1 chromosome partitioning protein ParB [Tepidanaerobacter syntrophicus]